MNDRLFEPLPRFAAPEDGRLSAEMLEAYQQAGVLILEDFVDAADCLALQKQAMLMVDEFDPTAARSVFSTTLQQQLDDSYFIESGDKIRFFLESDAFDSTGKLVQDKHQSLNKMGHAMHDLDPVFDRFSRTPKLANVTKSLDIADPGLIQSMYLFKPPRIGAEVVCHQDSTFIYTEPESCVGFWFALEEATIENGCLYFIPGQHHLPLRNRNYRVAPNQLHTERLDDTPFPEHLKLPAEARTGTLVIFHGRTPHLSGWNRTQHSRHAYSLHVIDRNCHYPKENWLQRGPALALRGFD